MENTSFEYFGPDNPSSCKNKKWFRQYPFDIVYQTNSRGYRDTEWPNDLDETIFCIGDSFTFGVGSPVEHTWPFLLEKLTGLRCINIAVNGASNELIRRKIQEVYSECNPIAVIACWSFTHRREANYETILLRIDKEWQSFYDMIKEKHWPKCRSISEINLLPKHIQTEIITQHNFPWWNWKDNKPWRYDYLGVDHFDNEFLNDDFENFQMCLQDTNAKNLIIPNFCHPDKRFLYNNLLEENQVYEVKQIDMARDYFHWDIKTSTQIVQYITSTLI